MNQLMGSADELQVVDVNKLKRKTYEHYFHICKYVRSKEFIFGFLFIFLNLDNTAYLISNFGAKQPASTSWTDSPGVHILRIWPHKITEGPLVGNLLVAFDGANLVQSFDVRWKTTVDTQDLLIYQLNLEIKTLFRKLGSCKNITANMIQVVICL